MRLRGTHLRTVLVAVLACTATAGATAGRAAARSSTHHADSVASIKTAPPASVAGDAQECDIAYQRYGACYDYAGASATLANQGAKVSFPVSAPTLAIDGYHTLMEMAVFNRTPAGIDQDTAEIGWTVDSQTSGQPPTPHLFIYHFVNTKGTCYNACGFVSTSKTIKPGMALTPDENVTWKIRNIDKRWTFFFNGTKIGYIPDSAYDGTFGHADKVNVYGEIAGAGDTPGCSQMGNGLFGHQAGSDTIAGLHLFGAAGQSGLTAYYPTDTSAWDSSATSAGLQLGGPGNCKPMAGTVVNSDGGYTVVGADTAAYPFPAGQSPWTRPATPPGPQVTSGTGSIVGVARDPATGGYWMTDNQGNVSAIDAPAYGGLNGVQTAGPIVGITAYKSGYLLVDSQGNVYPFNAPDHGGLGGQPMSAPVVGIAGTATGYLIADANGTVYAIHTTLPGGTPSGLTAPVTGIAADGSGYLLVDSAGDVAAVGTPYRGSLGGQSIPEPIISVTPSGAGYLLTDLIGNVYPFDAPFSGSVTNEGI